jgi:hypothetical protein
MFWPRHQSAKAIGDVGRYALAAVVLVVSLLWPRAANAQKEPASGAAEPVLNDARVPLDVSLMTLSRSDAALEDGTITPGYYQTSEYMIGHVAVGLILVESDGSGEAQSEDWTDEEVDQVQAEVREALAWWSTMEPAAHFTFTLETEIRIPSGYEPIRHGLPEEKLWIGEAMTALGFENDSYFSAVRDYVNDLRDRAASDWAFAILVADSSADDDGRFADGFFAYAYLGGPFMVMTYDNSGYGINNMGAVVAHEMGHVFRALDQYAISGMRCNYLSGYLDVKNGNSLAGGDCETDEPSLMRGGIAPYEGRNLDRFARGQIGWWDSDRDGVLDPVDAAPQLEVSVIEEDDAVLRFQGRAWQTVVPSPALSDVTISYIKEVGAWVDGHSWVQAKADDGYFDTVSETFTLDLELLQPGVHSLQLQSVNLEGLVSPAFYTTTFVLDPVDGALNSTLQEGPIMLPDGKVVEFDGLATAAVGETHPDGPTVAAVEYQIDGGEWRPAGAADRRFDSAMEAFYFVVSDLSEGLHSLAVRTRDSGGRVETNLEKRQFDIGLRQFHIYVPMVQR